MSHDDTISEKRSDRSAYRFCILAIAAGILSFAVIPMFTSYTQLWWLSRVAVDNEDQSSFDELDSNDPVVRYYLIRWCLNKSHSDENVYFLARCVGALEENVETFTVAQGQKFFESESDVVHNFGLQILSNHKKLTLETLASEFDRTEIATDFSLLEHGSNLSGHEQFELFKCAIGHSVRIKCRRDPERLCGYIDDIAARLWASNESAMFSFVETVIRTQPRTDIALALYLTAPSKYEPKLRQALRSRVGRFAGHNAETTRIVLELSIVRKLNRFHGDFEAGLPLYFSWLDDSLELLSTQNLSQKSRTLIRFTQAFGTKDLCEWDCNHQVVTGFIERYNQKNLVAIAHHRPNAIKQSILKLSGQRRFIGYFLYWHRFSSSSTKKQRLYTERPFSPLLPLHSLKLTGVIFDDAFLAELDKSATLMQKIRFFKFVGAQKCTVSTSGLAALVRNTSQRFWQSKVSKSDAAEYLRFLTVLKKFNYFGLSASQLQPAFGSKQDRVKHKAAFSFNIKSNSRASVKTGVDSGFRKLELLQAAAVAQK